MFKPGKLFKGKRLLGAAGIIIIGGISAINEIFADSADEFKADNESIEEADIQSTRRSDEEFERFTGSTEDEDSILNLEEDGVEEIETTEEPEGTNETEESDEVEVDEVVEEVEVANNQDLAPENNATETQATTPNTNTTEAPARSNQSGNATQEHSTQTGNRSNAQAQARAERERAEEQARAEREARERAEREAREAAERAAEEAAEKEARKLHPNQLLVNGNVVGTYAGNNVWHYNGSLSGNVSYVNNAGVQKNVSIDSVRVNSNYIEEGTGRDLSMFSTGQVYPVVIQNLGDGNLILHLLYSK